jgi:hypothetical protein
MTLKHPFDEAMEWPWEAVGNAAPSGKEPGLYINGQPRAFKEVGDRLSFAFVAALGKDALTLVLAREFGATDKDGFSCCQECGTRKVSPPKHSSTCASGALCARYRAAREGR